MLELELRPYAGDDFACIFPEDVSTLYPVIREQWERMSMGFSPSPYLLTKDLMVVQQIIRGDRRASNNIFGWKKVILNLPGAHCYNSSMPWVYNVTRDNEIAADLFSTLMMGGQADSQFNEKRSEVNSEGLPGALFLGLARHLQENNYPEL